MEVSGKLVDIENQSFGENFQFCEHCQFENITKEAKGICRECEEYMCAVCYRNHLKGKRNRTHELIDVNDREIGAKTSAREVVKCQQHDDETIKYYCRRHKAVGCGDCIVLEHSACKPEYIKDLSKGVQETEDFKNLRGKLEQLDCDNKANHEKIDISRRDCIKKHEEVLMEIRKYRQDLNTYLDRAEAVILSQAKQLVTETVNFLDQLENDWKYLASKIESFEHKLDTTVHRDDELFIQVVRNKRNIVELEQEIAKHVQRFSKVRHYDFVPDKELCSQMKSTTKFGNFEFSYPNKSEREETSSAMDMFRKASSQTRAGAPQQPAYGRPAFVQQQPRYGVQSLFGVSPCQMPFGVPTGQFSYKVPPGQAPYRDPPEPSDFKALSVKQASVVIGARVRRTGRVLSYGKIDIEEIYGTVTAVDSFSVKWDGSEETRSGYRIGGKGNQSVELV